MASWNKVFWLGAFILAGIAVAAWLVLFLQPSFGDGEKTLRVRFTNIERIGIGTQVTFAGKPVGEVVAIKEIYDARTQPADEAGNVYFYELVLQVDSSVDVYSRDEIIFTTSGFMGEKSIAIIPKMPEPGHPPPRQVTGEILYAKSTDKLDQALNQLNQVAATFQKTMGGVNQFLDQNAEDLNLALKSLAKSTGEASDFLTQAKETQLIQKTSAAVDEMHCVMVKAELAMDKANSVLSDVLCHDLVGKLENSLGLLELFSQKVISGQGTLGRLLNSDSLFLQVTALMSHMETVLSDINHYGLLFQYNKGWQRERTARMNRMQQLCTPCDFYHYFNNEMQSVSISLGRVSKLLEKMECREIVIENESFAERFSELLCKVENLEKSLRLYVELLLKQSCQLKPCG